MTKRITRYPRRGPLRAWYGGGCHNNLSVLLSTMTALTALGDAEGTKKQNSNDT